MTKPKAARTPAADAAPRLPFTPDPEADVVEPITRTWVNVLTNTGGGAFTLGPSLHLTEYVSSRASGGGLSPFMP